MLAIVNKRKRIMVQTADILFGWLRFALSRSSTSLEDDHANGKVKKILLIRTAYAGDVFLTLPALKPVRDAYPDAEITFLVCPAAAQDIVGLEYVDKVISYKAPWFYGVSTIKAFREYLGLVGKLRMERFDLAVDFRGDIRDIALLVLASGARHRVAPDIGGGAWMLTIPVASTLPEHKVAFHLETAKAVGGLSDPSPMRLPFSEEDTSIALSFLKGLPRPWIGMHPGGRLELKRWPIQRFSSVAAALSEDYNASIIVTGGPGEDTLGEEVIQDLPNSVNLATGALTFKQTQALISELDLFITNDTSTLHLAGGVNTPTIALFGPSESWDTGGVSDKSVTIEAPMTCRAACDTIRCSNDHFHACMRSITVNDVISAAAHILEIQARETEDILEAA